MITIPLVDNAVRFCIGVQHIPQELLLHIFRWLPLACEQTSDMSCRVNALGMHSWLLTDNDVACWPG